MSFGRQPLKELAHIILLPQGQDRIGPSAFLVQKPAKLSDEFYFNPGMVWDLTSHFRATKQFGGTRVHYLIPAP